MTDQDACCVCLQKDLELVKNPDMDSLLYCEPCFANYNLQRFYRPDFKPDARVQVEYDYIPVYDRKRRRYSTDSMHAMDLPKTQAYENKKNETPLTILELARLPHETIVATALHAKHPHPKDEWVRLDESNKKHDYYVMIDGKEQMDFLQSTSSVLHDYFPKDVVEPHELLFGDKNLASHELSQSYFTESKVSELKQFLADVLTPLQKTNAHKYDQHAFLDKILASDKWGPKHPKHGKYFSTDVAQLVVNLKQMHSDWDQKANDGQTRGTFVHYLIESDMNGQLDLATHPVYSQPHLNHIQQYLQWKREKFEPFFEPYRTEMRLCDCNEQMQSDYRRVGTCDLIAVPKNHPPPSETNSTLFVKLIDWKNTVIDEHSFFQKGKGYRMGKYPMDKVEDCNLRHYELQQADYQYMLCKFYQNFVYNGYVYEKIEFIGRELVCFDDSNPNNEAMIKQLHNNYKLELDVIWARRKREVEHWKQNKPDIKKQTCMFTDEQYSYLLTHLIRKNQLIADIRSAGRAVRPNGLQEHKR